MSKIKYLRLGGAKRLNEIVMAGSHDAGITEGGKSAKTQSLDIFEQAKAGVRFFDVRIAAEATSVDHGLGKEAELRTFHAPGMMQSILTPKTSHTRHLTDTAKTKNVTTTKINAGVFGMGLSKILADARRFVSDGSYAGEFLILKFDKSTNWTHIAETCVKVLGSELYTGGGNVNMRTLNELSGKVVVLFSSDGIKAVQPYYTGLGILPWKNLYKPLCGYDNSVDGLQYWGAGGTSIWKPFKKIKQNHDNQLKIMTHAGVGKLTEPSKKEVKRGIVPVRVGADPRSIGVMYWTSTGMTESIESRNRKMWSQRNMIQGLQVLWLEAFNAYVDNTLPDIINSPKFSSGGGLKVFMPNIVMVDFADRQKGDFIYDLNLIAMTKLVKATEILYEFDY